jgi:hypothetical protein
MMERSLKCRFTDVQQRIIRWQNARREQLLGIKKQAKIAKGATARLLFCIVDGNHLHLAVLPAASTRDRIQQEAPEVTKI